jgi:hypothetical protein
MEKILNDLKKSNKYFWFIPKGNKLALISQAKSKKEVKEKFNNKIVNKKDKYLNTDIIIAKIITVKKVSALEPGPIGIAIKFKNINVNGSIRNKDDIRINVVWFTEEYLLQKGFDAKYIIKLLTAVYFNKIKLAKLGIHLYDELKFIKN